MSDLNSTTIESPINETNALWLLVSFALIFLMIPGLSLFYSGFVTKLSFLRMITAMFMTFAVVCIQWFLFGYSLVFSQSSASAIIGDFEHLFLKNVGQIPNSIATTVPSSIFMIFQSLFAAITPCIIFGAIAEKITISSFLIISFFWTSLVYDFVAYWTWNKNGWLNSLGVLDFAGGGPVHIASGFSALAFTIASGPRARPPSVKRNKKPVISELLLGTGLLWFGWFGFNGGSEEAINSRAINAVATTNLSACVAGLTWVCLEALIKRTWRFSLEGFCSGAIAGLVAITPACGYVDMPSSLLIGFSGALVCLLTTCLMRLCKNKIQDPCDVFAVHGMGGVVGSILTGFLAKDTIASMSGDAIKFSGAIDDNWLLLAYQCLGVMSTAGWSFVVTFILVLIYRVVPFLKLKIDIDEDESDSSDLMVNHEISEMNEIRQTNEKGPEVSTFKGIKRPNKIFPISDLNASKSPVIDLKGKSSLRQKIELQNRVTVLTAQYSPV